MNRRGGPVSGFSGRSGRRNLNLDGVSVDMSDEDVDSQPGDLNDAQAASLE